MVSPLAHQPEPDSGRVIRRRNRIPVSCGSLKCNRANPCENCVKRGDAESCTYAEQRASSHRNKRPIRASSSTSSDAATAEPRDMQNRIDRLENLVLSLMNNGHPAAGAPSAQHPVHPSLQHVDAIASNGYRDDTSHVDSNDAMSTANDEDAYESDTEQVTKSLGVMKVASENNAYYFSDSHWLSVLGDLAEVRNFLIKNKAVLNQQKSGAVTADKDVVDPNSEQLDMVFGARPCLGENEIRDSFPPRAIAEIMMERFFALEDPLSSCLHEPTFRKQWEKHWQAPEATSLVWLAMNFALFRRVCIRWVMEHNAPDIFQGKEVHKAKYYKDLMIQCLLLAGYTKPHRHLVETILFLFYGDASHKGDTYVWTLSGLATHLAIRMGYHRDAKTFPNISVFEGEMRRRVWIYVRMSDAFYSHKAGMPAMIRSDAVDSELPRNLHDVDFNENTQVLPPSRPMSEPTIVSYGITKARVMYAFARALEHIHKIKGSSYEEVLDIDAEIREARTHVPEYLIPYRPAVYARLELLQGAVGIAVTYLKAQCLLHRRFLAAARSNPRYLYSRRACVDAALELLEMQQILYSKVDSHQQFRDRLSILCFFWEDYFMAAMLLCIDLAQGQENILKRYGRLSSDTERHTYITTGDEKEQASINALRDAYLMWYEERNRTLGAWRSVIIIGVLLEKIGLGELLAGKRVVRTDTHTGIEIAQQQSSSGAADGRSSFSHVMQDDSNGHGHAANANANVSGGPRQALHCQPVAPEFDLEAEKEKAAMTLNLLSSGAGSHDQKTDQFSSTIPANHAGPSSGESAAYVVQVPSNDARPPTDINSIINPTFSTNSWLAPDPTPMFLDPALVPSPRDVVEQMPDIQQFQNPDWSAWDNYLQNLTIATQLVPPNTGPHAGSSGEAPQMNDVGLAQADGIM
ncbi:GTPase of the mitochondrial inner membrane that associates with the large ribosomal subunit [Ascosphaera pollenicola]|nr:GTPase of the mitochondrial inner membrane that associates with the large ribosomal subunit [Ascosphaera pollenicola]